MWAYISPRNLVAFQRKAALVKLGEDAKALYDEGYYEDCDRILDEMNDRRREWEDDGW